MQKVINFLKIALLTLATFALSGAIWLGWRGYQALSRLEPEVGGAIRALRESSERAATAATAVSEVAEAYSEDLRSARSQKAVAAGLAAAASWQATARLVNTQLVPEAEGSLRELQKLLRDQNRELTLTHGQGREAIASLQSQVDGLGPEIGRLATSSAEVVGALQTPVGNLSASTAELTRILENLEKASESAPGMAQSLDRILASGSKWQRPISIATLLIALLGAIR